MSMCGVLSHSVKDDVLFDEIVEKEDVRRVPEYGRDCAVLLTGNDDFENVRRRGEILHQRVRGIERQRLYSSEVFENRENVFFRGAERSFKARAAELELCSAFIEMPRETGAKRDRAFKAWIANFR